MFIDSHCHINFPDLIEDLPDVLKRMEIARVKKALCVSVDLQSVRQILKITSQNPHIYASAGIHPNEKNGAEVSVRELCDISMKDDAVIAVGETGLDYFRSDGDMSWQQNMFRRHIQCAREVKKPLIIHTREAREDTIKIMKEEKASEAGGVMHCFTETLEMAEAAMDMGFMISFSGIVTFKNADQVKQVAKRVPLDFMLIETDSPYLAPVPYRGKTNEPSFVPFVAEEIARLKNSEVETVALRTSENFHRLFL